MRNPRITRITRIMDAGLVDEWIFDDLTTFGGCMLKRAEARAPMGGCPKLFSEFCDKGGFYWVF